MESLDLADRRRPPHTCHDMFNPVSSAELRELGDASSGGVELGSSIRQDLIRLPILTHGFFEELDRMLRRRVMVDP